MKKIVFIVFATLTMNGFSQTYFDIGFNRDVTASLLNNENDSIFSDQAHIKIFESGSVSSVELKYYTYSDSTFTEVHNSTTLFSSITDTPCGSDYCFYKANPSIIVIDLGSHSAVRTKHKVYIKINGTTGKGYLVKEVEL